MVANIETGDLFTDNIITTINDFVKCMMVYSLGAVLHLFGVLILSLREKNSSAALNNAKPADMEHMLLQLNSLKENGLITEEEYEQKKKDILKL